MKGNRKGFCRYISRKGTLLSWTKNPMRDMEKVLSGFFTCSGLMHLQTKVPYTSGKIWSKQDFDLLEEDWVMEHLNRPDVYMWAGAHRRYSQVVRELADVIARPLLIIFETSWTLEMEESLSFRRTINVDPWQDPWRGNRANSPGIHFQT